MKAAVLKAFGQPLEVEDVPEPPAGTGEVVVEMAAAGVLAYSADVFSGARGYLLELPIVPGPGGIGRIAAIGSDATRLAVGDWVYCDTTVRSRDDVLSPDIILQGLTAGSEAGMRLQRRHHDGSYAERLRTPTENVFAIGAIERSSAKYWCRVGALLVPFGGLLAIDLKAGETLVVNGATGRFGSAAVELAAAMGAGCIIATGRNEGVLEALASRHGSRVRPVVMTGEETADRAAILEAAPGPVDSVFDILPPAASPAQVRAAVLSVRRNGRVVLMGGVGMAGGPGLELPYPWIMRNNVTIRGQWMYPREAIPRLIRLVQSGLIRLDNGETTSFALQEINAAVAHAAANSGPFSNTVIEM